MEPHVIQDFPVKSKEEGKVVQREKVLQGVEVLVEEKPALMNHYVPVVNGYCKNLTTGLYRQISEVGVNITAIAYSEAEEINMIVPKRYGSAKMVAMAQS